MKLKNVGKHHYIDVYLLLKLILMKINIALVCILLAVGFKRERSHKQLDRFFINFVKIYTIPISSIHFLKSTAHPMIGENQ